MTEAKNLPLSPRTAALAAILLAALAACTEPQQPVEECEPGVNEISDAANLVPGNC